MHLRSLILIPTCISLALAQESPPVKVESPPANAPAAEPVKPIISKLDENRFQIGEVILDRKTREIRFPTTVNMADGLIEYVIVLEKGKVHEALLLTTASPTHLNVALTLLRYAPSRELFPMIAATGHPTGIYQETPAAVKAAARITIELEWNDSGTIRRVPLNEWLQNPDNETALAAGPWLYTGSGFSEGKYIPELTGDILAIMVDPHAVINCPGSDNYDQAHWHAFSERIPPVGTKVSVVITPYSPPKPAPKQ